MPRETCHPWLSQLEPVNLARGQVLREPGRIQPHVYFPTTAIVSLLHVTLEGGSVESAVIGPEGMVGLSLCMGGESATHQAVVQNPGQGLRLRSRAFQELFSRSQTGRRVLLRYAQALITQMSQTVVCNRHHGVDQQLCRCLLMRLDRMPGQPLQMTHAQISGLLGVRREGVTEHAHQLQNAGLIRYARGHIEVLDRAGLERRVCECYLVVRREYDRLLHTAMKA
ncbi:MAG: Crp/Fnr family transcriptional regulator [Hylemonella sp.]|uniref:Crp/Fnr family transcriptional regulator n=1 Tax=Hylemonella sp. TaxID=2066020 RepID=UPI0022C15A3D|nr:Crp/Fnr family transcriptional regulator [Hylemonella sp.]MCZ8252342.1 Crp/Fnr family transcriptional regulator [Hylemonella sp.]